MGKSTIVRLLTKYLGNRVYFARKTDPFYDLISCHKIIIWDEFHYKSYDLETLKLFLAGEPFPITKKYVNDRIFANESPCIMISNYTPPLITSFRNRITVIHADVSLQEDDTGEILITDATNKDRPTCIIDDVLTDSDDGIDVCP